jgi:hypothetical protein
MKQRNSNILLWFAGVAVITAILLFLLLVHRSVPKTPITSTSQCTSSSNPCIAILDEAGKTVAKVNDFRFGPQGCIYYRSSVNVTYWHEHCGGYTMEWIGPGQPTGREGTI